ncbi:MAG: hypothetical protein ABIP03_07495 [Aquihabitans sp.]
MTASGGSDTVDGGDVQRAMWAVGEAHRRRSERGDDIDDPAESDPPGVPEPAATEAPSAWFG